MFSVDPKNCIAGWFFTESEIREAISGQRILNPSLDLSNPCNLNCPYCYVEEKNSYRKVRRPDELTISETFAVIDELSLLGSKTLNIVGAGEPTIDPNFPRIIEYLSTKGLDKVIFTNGISISRNPNLVLFLRQHRVSVVLKYNSSKPEIQDAIVGRKGYAKKRDLALEILMDEGFAAHEPTRLGLDIMVFRGNLEEISEIHRLCRENNFFPIAGDYIPTGRTEDGKFQGYAMLKRKNPFTQNWLEQILKPISKQERSSILKQLKSINKDFGIKDNGIRAYYGGGVCTQILGLYIDISGNVWPCVARKIGTESGFIEKPLGNIRTSTSLSQLWLEHPYMIELRRAFDGHCPYKSKLIR